MLVTLGALRVKKYKRRFRWKNLKKIETDCNCDLWKLVSQTDFKDHFCCLRKGL